MGNGSGAPEPNHLASFRSEGSSYALAEGEDTLVVALEWAGGELAARKVYTFHRGLFQIDLEMTLENRGATPWRGRAYPPAPAARAVLHVRRFVFVHGAGALRR
jgi:YidC/Oxa1 family membrane protein insertase